LVKHFAHRVWLQLLLLWLTVAGAWAHDASSYGGVFRSRNLGGTWLSADVGLFLNAALVVAINPRQQTHLLVGTDLGVLGSRNAGLSWTPEATDLIFGAVFAVTFLHDGEDAICAAQSGVFRRHAGRWTTSDVPEGAVPAKALVSASAERVYLLGRNRLFISRDGGQRFVPAPGSADPGAISALAVVRAQPETVVAVIDGQIMASDDGGQRWRPRGLGRDSEPVEFVAADLYVPQRLWAAQGSRLSVSDDLGAAWRTLERSLPEPTINVRGIAANVEATTVLVSSNRGLFRSENGGASWVLKEDNLPIHLEAGPLARDPGDAGLIYAVYSLIPYSEVWRGAVEGGNLMRRLDPVSLAGGIAFWLLLMLAGWWTVQRLARPRGTDRDSPPC
jgi:photosystem II stability/assembly factor-like uncharacterized protein